MKKILFVTVLLFCVFILSSCDYPEKIISSIAKRKHSKRSFQLASMLVFFGLRQGDEW